MSAVVRFLLDTNIANYIIRGANVPLRKRLGRTPIAELGISSVTQAELLYGTARRPDAKGLQVAVHEFIARLDVRPWDAAAAEVYGGLRARLEEAGTPLGGMDLMIAAHALALKASLVTNDRAFARVSGLTVLDWSVG